jgi:hypothetical protein
MDIRIELRTHNWPLSKMLKGPYGYGAYEVRHREVCHDREVHHIAMTNDQSIYKIDDSKAVEGPAIARIERVIRGKCDKERMLYVLENGIKFLYRSKFYPNRANAKQTCTPENLKNEADIVREYCEWVGGKYLPPEPARRVNGILVYDDGGVRIKD